MTGRIPGKRRGAAAALLTRTGAAAVTLLTALLVAGVPLASGAVRALDAAPPRTVSVAGVNALSRIACPTTTSCVAVGSSASDPLDGASVVVKVTTGAVTVGDTSLSNGTLNAVACPSGTSCLAVADDAVVAVAPTSAAAHVVATPAKPANGIVALGDIACAGTGTCYAVGFEGPETDSRALVVSLSSAGQIERTTLDTGTGSSSVACPTSTECLLADAVSGLLHIQLFKDGKPGTSHVLPAHTYVESMSCYGASLCYVLGGNSESSPSSTDELLPVDPATGAVGAPVTIGGHFSGTSLTCINRTTCLVAGAVVSGDVTSAAVVTLDHGSPGTPVGYPGSNLSGVACASPTACIAVGRGSTVAIVDRVVA